MQIVEDSNTRKRCYCFLFQSYPVECNVIIENGEVGHFWTMFGEEVM
jgi:hypothetical protein